MLVRNNTKCPSCGKCTATDLYAPTQPSNLRGVILRAECYECYAFSEKFVDYSVLHGWCRLLAVEAKGLADSWTLASRWTSIRAVSLTLSQRGAVDKQIRLFFTSGTCLSKFVGSPTLFDIRRKLQTPGDLMSGVQWEDFCYAWFRL